VVSAREDVQRDALARRKEPRQRLGVDGGWGDRVLAGVEQEHGAVEVVDQVRRLEIHVLVPPGQVVERARLVDLVGPRLLARLGDGALPSGPALAGARDLEVALQVGQHLIDLLGRAAAQAHADLHVHELLLGGGGGDEQQRIDRSVIGGDELGHPAALAPAVEAETCAVDVLVRSPCGHDIGAGVRVVAEHGSGSG
jgi:hypothetical protein